MVEEFIKGNSKWLLVTLFFAGAFYAEMKSFRTVEERLDKKIKVIQENKEEIQELRIEIVRLTEQHKCK